MALKIKDAMSSVYALLISYKECENKMREAALEEMYAEASRFKIERDTAKVAALQALNEVEQEFIGSIDDRDLSLSTIKDESFVSHKSTTHSYFNDEDQISVASKIRSPFKRNDFKHNESSIQAESLDEQSQDEESNAPCAHPLAGVDNAESLPTPEEISKDVSSDLAHEIEDLFGGYLTKCLFSKVSAQSHFNKNAHIVRHICLPCPYFTLFLLSSLELATARCSISKN
jgi:ribosomal protein L20A (L18A)